MSGEFHKSIEDVKLHESPIFTVEDINKNSLSCELCSVKVTSENNLLRHLEGRRHKMKAERKDKTFICDICGVVANSEIQLNIHRNSIKHKNKLTKKDQGEFARVSPSQAGLWILLFCVVCIFINLLLLLFKVICN